MYGKKIPIILFASFSLTFLFINCEDSSYVEELGFEIGGVVLDSALQQPVQGVLVGFYPDLPDSVLIVGDSINTNYIYLSTRTNDLGKFRVSEIGAINMQEFQQMFAWKKDYKLWRYTDEPVPVNEIDDSWYELTIFLTKN